MDILQALVKRLETVQKSEDPDEAEALHQWFLDEGWEKLKPSVVQIVENIANPKQLPTLMVEVRVFNQVTKVPFEVLPYNTWADLQEAVAKHFELPKDQIQLLNFSGVPSHPKQNQKIGEIFIDKKGVIVVPTDKATWYQDEKGAFKVPVFINETYSPSPKPEQVVTITIPSRNVTVGDVARAAELASGREFAQSIHGPAKPGELAKYIRIDGPIYYPHLWHERLPFPPWYIGLDYTPDAK